MKYDQFMYFSAFSADQQETLKAYFSPDCECSIFKGVPLEQADEFKRLARILNPGCRIRVRYRGPRYDSMRQTCLKRNARSVAIYVDN
jgi:hypothetical protein